MKYKEKYGSVSNLWYIYRDMARTDRFLLLIILLGILSGVLLPLVGIYVPKAAVEVAQGLHTADAVRTFAFLIGASALLRIIQNFYEHIVYIRINTFQNLYLKRLLQKYLTCDYKIIESEDGQEQYRKALNAVTSGGSYGSGIPCMLHASIDLAIRFLDIAIYISMLAGLNLWIAAIITVFSIIDAAVLKKARDYETAHRDEFGKCLKKSAYLERAAADTAAGKDLRIFNMRGRFAALWDRTIAEMKSVLWACKRRHADADAVHCITTYARNIVMYGYLIYRVCSGGLGIGDFVLYFGVATEFSRRLRAIAYYIFRINIGSIQVKEMRSFLDLRSEKQGGIRQQIMAPPEIEFRDVCFSYGEKKVLDHVSFKIGAGERIAIVGVNGAGKTTIVKLLCGFYYPDSGEILINGIPTTELAQDSLTDLYSVIFQESSILPYTLAENISMRDRDLTDADKVRKAVDRADLSGKVSRLPQGILSNMTKLVYDDGILLSGGETQKLLMARALYKDAPVLILDEPTAALDPIAESETYARFDSITENKTAVYISHRLASTRFCDCIIMLSGSRIAETGTHEELIANGGEYAKMFEIQKKYYAEGAEAE